MTLRIGLWTTVGLLLMVGPVMGQQTPRYQPQPPRQYRPVQPVHPQAGPNQPVGPRVPTLQRSPTAQRPSTVRQPGVRQPVAHQPPRAPFRLTPQQEAELDRVLIAWEQQGKKVRTFACDFTLWKYDPVSPKDRTKPNEPQSRNEGKLKYAAPDKGMFHVEADPLVEGDLPDHWVCDGKSVFEFNSKTKQVIEHQLPPALQGKAISNGPLPFLFGAEAAKLKQRYFMRIVTPPKLRGEQIWLEAFPRFQQDAADFHRVELILTTRDMQPYGLQIFETNGKSRKAYLFYNIVTNDPFGFLKGNPFHPFTPLGWKKVVEPAARPAARPQVTLQPRGGGAR